MALTATATPRLIVDQGTFNDIASIAVCTDLSLAAIVSILPSENPLRCYRSDDNGATWSLASSLPAFEFTSLGPNLLAWPGNILTYAAAINDEQLSIFRSDDGGLTWTTAATFSTVQPEFGPLAIPSKGATNRRSAGMYSSNIYNEDGLGPGAILNTTNSGASWTRTNMTFATGLENTIFAVSCGDDGRAYLGGWPAVSGTTPEEQELYIHLSTNFGATWTRSAQLPIADNSHQTIITDFAVLTDTLILAGAEPRFNENPVTRPVIYRSTDGGNTWSLIATHAVADWPTSPPPTTITNLKRLTRDSCLAQISAGDATLANPWRISVDQGATYPIIPTATFAGLVGNLSGLNHATVAPNGRILAPATWYNGSIFVAAIYSIELSC